MRRSHTIDSSSRMRVTHASARPKRRADGRREGGSRLTATEMNTRLSTPSTISSEDNVNSATQNSVVVRTSKPSPLSLVPRASRHARPKHQSPAHQHVHHAHEHRSRTHV